MLLVEVMLKRSRMSWLSHEFTLEGLDHWLEVAACKALTLLSLLLE